jgi:hypothetical protein
MKDDTDDCMVKVIVATGFINPGKGGRESSRDGHLPIVFVETSTLYNVESHRDHEPRTGVHHPGPEHPVRGVRVRSSGVKGSIKLYVESRGRPVRGVAPVVLAEVEGNFLVHTFRCITQSGMAAYEHWGSVNSILLLHKHVGA